MQAHRRRRGEVLEVSVEAKRKVKVHAAEHGHKRLDQAIDCLLGIEATK